MFWKKTYISKHTGREIDAAVGKAAFEISFKQDGDTKTCDKTYAEITAAIESCKTLVIHAEVSYLTTTQAMTTGEYYTVSEGLAAGFDSIFHVLRGTSYIIYRCGVSATGTVTIEAKTITIS